MTQAVETDSAVQESTPEQSSEPRPSRFAAWRWGLFVTAFLIGQISLGYAAVRYANSDGGARPIEGAEERVAQSYAELSAPSTAATANGNAKNGDSNVQ